MAEDRISFEPGDGSFTRSREVYPGTYRCISGGPEILDGEPMCSECGAPWKTCQCPVLRDSENSAVPVPDPAPKPTAEERMEMLITTGLYQMTDETNKAAVIAGMKDAANAATRKAFEEAAEAAEKNCTYVSRLCVPDKEDICQACQAAEDIRALAKE